MARAAAPAMPLAMPADVRLMNAVSALVYAGALLTLLAAALLWLTRSPWFAIQSIELDGELGRNSINTIRANAMPRLAGNFFSVDLQAARDAFQNVPWVRRAVVRRVWPDRLAVTLEEHVPAALWRDAKRSDLLVNVQGEVFEANVGDVEDEDLPVLEGPVDTAAQMLQMHRRLTGILTPLRSEIDALSLTGRGSWRAELRNGAALELGRGPAEAVLERTARFVRTLPQVEARWPQQPLEYADLRHTEGYAVRLRGVTTRIPPGTKLPKRN